MSAQCPQIFIVCLAAVLIASSSADEFPLEGGRIVGGQLTTIDKLPYLVQLRNNKGRVFCGGTLVTSTYVISAAHCVVKPNDYKTTLIVAGATYNDEIGVNSTIAESHSHPLFKDQHGSSYDIVVFKLARPLTGKNIKPLKLCSRRLAPGQTIQVSGWGRTVETGKKSHQVRTVFVPLFPWNECSRRYGKNKISRTMICAGNLGSQDSCLGDSGGPAVIGNELCAVVSWGNGCASHWYPGVYTVINSVRQWINQVMQVK